MAQEEDAQSIEFDGNVPGLESAFADVLRHMRKTRSMSQQALATESGLGRVFISLLERGLRRPSLATLFLLAQALNSTPAAMVQEVDNAVRKRNTPLQTGTPSNDNPGKASTGRKSARG